MRASKEDAEELSVPVIKLFQNVELYATIAIDNKVDMNKKVKLLLILCIGTAVVSGVTVIYELSPYAHAVETSIGEINSNPSAWVNRTVVVEGKLCGPLGFIPETAPPWNFELFGSNETIETIGKPETDVIGVLWNGEDDYDFENTMVVGVVREGRWGYLWGENPVCYYIEAKKIDRL